MWEIDRTAPRRALLMVAATPPIGSARAAQPPSPPLRLTAADYAARCRTDSTKRAYAADWRGFESWCRACGASALPSAPSTIGAYLADAAARLKPATLKRQLATIVVIHRQPGRLHPRSPRPGHRRCPHRHLSDAGDATGPKGRASAG